MVDFNNGNEISIHFENSASAAESIFAYISFIASTSESQFQLLFFSRFFFCSRKYFDPDYVVPSFEKFQGSPDCYGKKWVSEWGGISFKCRATEGAVFVRSNTGWMFCTFWITYSRAVTVKWRWNFRMSSAWESSSLGYTCILPWKCAAVRSGGHHGELRSGEKWMSIGLSVVRRGPWGVERNKKGEIGHGSDCKFQNDQKSAHKYGNRNEVWNTSETAFPLCFPLKTLETPHSCKKIAPCSLAVISVHSFQFISSLTADLVIHCQYFTHNQQHQIE